MSTVTVSHLSAMMLLLCKIILLVSAAMPVAPWSWDNASTPISIFRSRPDLQAPILTIQEGLHKPNKMAPGYFFVAPYLNMQQAVYIYDNNCDLVWTSFGSAGAGEAHAPRVCDYEGEKHLCFYQGVQHTGWGHGHGLILDKHYRVVKSVEPSGTYQTSSDMHEFYLIDDGKRALLTQYVRSVYDMCPWGGCDGLGYIQSGVFQDIDVETDEALFTWNSLDHISPEESLVLPATTEISGNGESPESPWDYFHINSIDKSSYDGNYLISARHTCALYKISAATGQVLWRLGGSKSDYEIGEGVGFAYQHDARWIEDSADESIISIFDNGGNGFDQPETHSRGIIIKVDHRNKKTSLVSSLDPPWVDGHQHITKSQGNYQTTLKNGGSLMGWGNDPYFTEYAGDGEIVFYGALAYGWMMGYRVYKFDEWVGEPLSKPATWSFSRYGVDDQDDKGNNMVIYTSWNGHTEIKAWTFYGADQKSGPWKTLADGFAKQGFETIYKHEKTYRYVYAEAIDKDSRVLGKTAIQETFVPNELMRERYCDELACYFMDTNNPDREAQREKMQELWAAKVHHDAISSEGASDSASSSTSETTIDDLYSSVYNDGPLMDKHSRKTLFAISFSLLGLVVIAIFGMATRRYHTVQVATDRVAVMLGMKPRRREEVGRGKYAGVDNGGDDFDDSDGDDPAISGDGDSPKKARHLRGQSGLELERQLFWRNSP